MTDIAALRAEVFDLACGICEWPECPIAASELAHIEGKKMGGRKTADRIENVAALCKDHHDLLDGRSFAGRKYATRVLFHEYLRATRPLYREARFCFQCGARQ